MLQSKMVFTATSVKIIYSRTSVARTPMARLPRLFRTRSWVPNIKNTIAADMTVFGKFRVIFFLYRKWYVVCTH